MPRKRFSAEQIVVLLRQIEVLMSQGKAAPVACREAGISQQLRDECLNQGTHPAKTTVWVAFDRVMRLKQPVPRRSAEANSKAEVRRCAWRGDLASGRACRRAKLADQHH